MWVGLAGVTGGRKMIGKVEMITYVREEQGFLLALWYVWKMGGLFYQLDIPLNELSFFAGLVLIVRRDHLYIADLPVSWYSPSPSGE